MHGLQDASNTSPMAMAGCQVDMRLSGVQRAACELLQGLSRIVDEPICAQLTYEEAVVLVGQHSRMDCLVWEWTGCCVLNFPMSIMLCWSWLGARAARLGVMVI